MSEFWRKLTAGFCCLILGLSIIPSEARAERRSGLAPIATGVTFATRFAPYCAEFYRPSNYQLWTQSMQPKDSKAVLETKSPLELLPSNAERIVHLSPWKTVTKGSTRPAVPSTKSLNSELSVRTLGRRLNSNSNIQPGSAKSADVQNDSSKTPLSVSCDYPTWTEQKIHEVPIPGIVLSFSHAMVDREMLGRSPSDEIASVIPTVKGKWFWIDSKSLMFQPVNDKFMLGTTYSIGVKSGVKALNGLTLSKDFAKTLVLSLPMPQITESASPQAVILNFRHAVDGESILPKLTAKLRTAKLPPGQVPGADYGTDVLLRMTSDDEARKIVGPTYQKNITFAFRPATQVQPGEALSITLKDGVKALSGLSHSSEVISTTLTFHTQELQPEIAKTDVLEPNQPIVIPVNDYFDSSFFAKWSNSGQISVQPTVENLEISFADKHIILTGQTRAGTTYSVTIAGGFKGGSKTSSIARTVEVPVGAYKPRLLPPAHPYQLFRGFAPAKLPISSVNVERIKVKLYDAQKVNRSWEHLQFTGDTVYSSEALLGESLVSPKRVPNSVVTTELDISKYFHGVRKPLLITVEVAAKPDLSSNFVPGDGKLSWTYGSMPPFKGYTVAVQASSLSVSCVPALNNCVFYVADAASGRPVAGAKISCDNLYGFSLQERGLVGGVIEDANQLRGETDEHGIAIIRLKGAETRGLQFLVATETESMLVATERSYWPHLDLNPTISVGPPQSGTQFAVHAPFKSSRGLFITNNGAEINISPVNSDSPDFYLFAPLLSPKNSFGYAYLKLYDTEGGARRKGEVAANAVDSFSYGAMGEPKVELRSSGYGDRRTAGDISIKLLNAPLEVKNQIFDWKLQQFGVMHPSTTDSIPSPKRCPLVGLAWQVEQCHRFSRGHEFGGHSPLPPTAADIFPLPAKEYPNANEKSPSALPQMKYDRVSVSVQFPKKASTADSFSIPLTVKNLRPKTTLDFSLRAKNGFEVFKKSVDVESGVTAVLLDKFENVLELDKSSRSAKLVIEDRSYSEESPSQKLWTFDCDTKLDQPGTAELITRGIVAQSTNSSVPFCGDTDVALNSTLKVSNNLSSFIRSAEEQMVNAPIQSVMQRATRVLALCERRTLATASDRPDKYDALIESDVEALRQALRNHGQWMSWFPEGDNNDNHGGRVYLPVRIVLDAVTTASFKRIDKADEDRLSQDLDWFNITNLSLPEYVRNQCYTIYLGARFAKEAELDEQKKHFWTNCDNLIDAVFKANKIEELTDESLVYLILASRMLPGQSSRVPALERQLSNVLLRVSAGIGNSTIYGIAEDSNKFISKVNSVCHSKPDILIESNMKQDIPSVFDSITAASLLLYAQLEKSDDVVTSADRQISDRLAKFLEGTAYSGKWNGLSTGLALRALYRQDALSRREGTVGQAELSNNGVKLSENFSSGSPLSKTVALVPTINSAPILNATAGIRYEIDSKTARRLDAHESSQNQIYKVSREFLSEATENKDNVGVWQSKDGTWHCKRDTELTMRVLVLPKERRTFVATMIPSCAGLVPVEPTQDLTYDSARVWDEAAPPYRELYNKLPQKLTVDDDGLKLYSRAISPQLYRFDYKFKTPFVGTFYVPAVSIKEAFSCAKSEYIDHTTLVVEDEP